MRHKSGAAIGIAAVLLAIAPEHARPQKEVFGWNQTAGTNTTYVNDPYYHSLEYYSPFWFKIQREDTTYELVARQLSYHFTDMRDFANAVRATYPDTMKIVPMVQLLSPTVDDVVDTARHRTAVIRQIAAVVDTLNFHGINIDFEYPSEAMRDSFSAFMAELAESLPGTKHVSCAVAPVRHSYSDAFDYGTLSDGAHGDLLIEMVYDKYPIESVNPDEHRTGPTTPLWWWKENADVTKAQYDTTLSFFAMAGPTFGLDYHVTATGNASRRARAIEDGNTKPYFDGLGAAISLSQATHDNNANNYPIQWSVARGWPLSYGGDSTMYIPYTQGATNRQLWWTGAEDWGRFLAKLDGVGIEHAGVWCATTNSDSLIWQTLARWKANQPLTVPLEIDSLWADNDTCLATNGGVDHPWTPGPDTLYLKQHVLAARETVAQARASVVTDSLWDSIRFRYKLTRAGNVRLAVLRNVDSLWTVGAADDTVCVYRSSLQDSAMVRSPFDESHWGEPWAWIAENFGYTLKSDDGDTARVINEVVWNGEIDTLYVQRGPLPEEPWSEYPRRGTDCDSNYIADEGVYLALLEVDEFADAGFGAEDTQKLESTKAVVVDRFAPYVKKLELLNIWPGESEAETTVVRSAEWRSHPTIPGRDSLFVDEKGFMSLDTLVARIQFSERMTRGDSLKIRYRLQKEGGPAWTMNVVRWDSIVYPDDAVVARSAVVWTGTLRSIYAGDYVVEVTGYDTALNTLDTNPATRAQRGAGGAWEGYEGEDGMSRQEGGRDRNHWFMLTPWRDVLLHMDVSASVTNPPTGGWASSAYHMADSLLARMKQDHEDSGRADIWRAGVARYWAGYDEPNDTVEVVQDLSPNIEAARNALIYFISPPGTPCSSQGEPLDSVVAYLEAPGNHSMPRHVVMFTDGEMNRGVSRAVQEELWVRAATDSTFGCGTFLYAIMPEAKANLSDGMCEAVRRSGGRYLTIPEADMIARYPGGVLYDDLVHNGRIYEAGAEGSGTRSTHWFRVAAMPGSLFLLGSWAPWGLQLAQGELLCGGLPKCRECGGDGAGEAAEGQGSEEVVAGGGSSTEPEREAPGETEEQPDAGGDATSRLSMNLYDAGGAVVPPTGTIGGSLAWWELSVTEADTGLWRVEVSGGSGPYDLRVSERGGVRIELAGKRLTGVNTGYDVKVRVESEWSVESPSWSLVDGEGGTVASLSLYDDGLHGDGLAGDAVYGGSMGGVAEPGLYRVRMTGVVNGMGIERVTGEGLWVTRPEFAFLTPAGIDTVEANYLITWTDSSEFAAQIGLYYDTDSLGADGVLIVEGIEEDEEGAYDQYLWNTMTAPEGRYWVYAVISDGIGPPRTIYSPGSIVLEREYHPGWPVTVGGEILAPVTLADLDGDGSEETIVGAGDSLLYVLNHDGTNRSGFPVHCQGGIGAGVAVGDVDGDGLKELIAVTGDYWGPAYVWVLDDEGNVEPGWPIAIAQGTRSTPLLVNLVGAASSPPEIVVAGYDSLVRAWQGEGSVVAGWPRKLNGMIQDSSPVGGDIDGDGANEVVVARTAGWPAGAITALETDGTVKWEKTTPSYLYSAPALWDVDKDRRPEVIVTTSNPSATGWLYVLNGENGSDASGWSGGKNIGQGSWASPAVGYLTVADEPRIVVANGVGEVRAYSRTGGLVWSEDVSTYGVKTSPLIADLDGDMSTEIVLATRYRLCVLAGATGDTISAYNRPLGTDTQSTVAVADLEGDGDLEIVVADGTVIRCWDIAGTVWADGQQWPQFKRDEEKTGRYREDAEPEGPGIVGIEVVAPDSLRIRWEAVRVDTYGRPEWIRRYRVYRGGGPYQETWGTQVGLVNAPDTVFVERPGTVNDPNASSYYRVRAEDLYGNQSALSDETVGEFERSTGAGKGNEKGGVARR